MDAGQVAYEGYRVYAEGRSLVTGDDLPEWHGLAPEVRAAWRAAADAVVMWLHMGGAE